MLRLPSACSRGVLALRSGGIRCNLAAVAARLRVVGAVPLPTQTALASTCRSYITRKIIQRLPRLVPRAASAPDFYSEDHGFEDLGISTTIQEALKLANFSRPSRVQEMVMPILAKGKNAVVAAETGSGKTLAYIAPLASMLLRQRERRAAAAAAAAATDDTARQRQAHALILCPNVALCQQVLAVTLSLKSADGTPLLSAAYINASNPPPKEAPEIIISTPAAMLGFINGPGADYGYLWSTDGLPERVRHVVLDEADMLLGRAFDKPVMQLLQLFKTHDRRRVEAKVFQELNISKTDFERLPRSMQVTCWKEGSPGLKAAGYRVPGGWEALDAATFGPYWRRQYVFAAATMPSVTMSDVGSDIDRMFPDVQWLASDLLHQSKPRLQHTWTEVKDTTFRKAIISSICDDPDYAAGTSKTLVFAGLTSAADELSELLHNEGIEHVVYHKHRPADERAAALEAMSQPSVPQGRPRVMVCTDAAARGLDIQDVTHVVQADFAPNAIDFIHRIGRTGRADRSGKVTSLYREHNLALVEVLRSYVEEGRPLEAAFSRARSFSRKMKRKGGEFIPRGMTKAQFRDDPDADAGEGAAEDPAAEHEGQPLDPAPR